MAAATTAAAAAARAGVNMFQVGSPAAWTPPEDTSAFSGVPVQQPLPKLHQLVIRQDLAGVTVRERARTARARGSRTGGSLLRRLSVWQLQSCRVDPSSRLRWYTLGPTLLTGATSMPRGGGVCHRAHGAAGAQEHLSQTGFRDINLQDDRGRTPLHLACVLKNADIVRQLLRRGAFVHAAGVQTQATPLHCACVKGNYEVAKILIKYGASLDAPTVDGITPLAMLPRTVESKKFAKGPAGRCHTPARPPARRPEARGAALSGLTARFPVQMLAVRLLPAGPSRNSRDAAAAAAETGEKGERASAGHRNQRRAYVQARFPRPCALRSDRRASRRRRTPP